MNFFRKIAAALDRYDDEHNFTCDLCGREVFSGERVCAPCRKTLPWNDGPICPFCGRKVGEEGVCLECKQKPLATDLARSAFTHEMEAQRLVLRFKGGSRYLFRTTVEAGVFGRGAHHLRAHDGKGEEKARVQSIGVAREGTFRPQRDSFCRACRKEA